MRIVRLVGVVAMVVAALGLTACGSSSDDKGPSKADFVAKANGICTTAKKQIADIKVPNDLQTNPQAAAAYFTKVSAAFDSGVADLKKVEAPDALKSDYDAYVAKQGEYATKVAAIRDKAKAKDASGLDDLKNLDGINKETDAAATKAGLKACAAG
jgi:uncharacterized lipoprotein